MSKALAFWDVTLKHWKHTLLIVAYQRTCQHYHRAARLYMALADHERDLNRRALLRKLSAHATYCARTSARGLTMFHGPVPGNLDGWPERIARRLLVLSGTSIALIWQEWDEQGHALLFGVLGRAHHNSHLDNK